jgi:FkbM family methyltransferase
MLISVVVTTFRRPTLLGRAICSVLDQALPEGTEVELIVSDDDDQGSAMPALPAALQGRAASVSCRYLKRGTEPGGVAGSRNRALHAAQGDWVLFLDDDDALLPGALQHLLEQVQQNDLDLCCGSHDLVGEDADGRELARERKTVSWRGFDQLLVGNVFPMGAFLMRRSAVRVGFSAQLKTHEDWLFLLDNLKDLKVGVTAQAVLEIRQVADGSRDHRNQAGGAAQKAADYARIYSLHPAPQVAAMRQAILRGLGGVSVDTLIGAPAAPQGAPSYCETMQGRFLICNPQETIQAALMQHGQFEPLAARIAAAMTPLKEGCVLDVGANQGIFSVPVARALPDREVLAFEPQRLVFMQLCANLLGNRLMNVLPCNGAVGKVSEPGQTISVPCFNVFEERYTGSVSLDGETQRIRGQIAGVAEPSQWARQHDQVPLRPLDELVAGRKVSFIKIDVEGMELAVLQSGEKVLREQRPSLFFEAWSLPQFNEQRSALLSHVMGLGYALLKINEDYFAYHPSSIDEAVMTERMAALGLYMPERRSVA